ncbi:hypothetical protein GPECTOR_3g215 [Gonium pectorale]|uniref:Uncharacterized protein n=1 Tax=Gonium pectorale TaxID=33097 RepID=A0A150GYS2_GONPE|nr:hypothetical protein GPECTOR_3g215 [Gonium pectorale]|eukprot:KXZ55057.1 hypothetical protein GPECTOR_3g215 [Gonium pectorale]
MQLLADPCGAAAQQPAMPASFTPTPQAPHEHDSGFTFKATGHSDNGFVGIPVGNRRGRKPKPRVPDLQQQVDALMERFQHLSRENGFLRNKLKALERIMPQRDSSLGFLASVQGGASARQLMAAEAATLRPGAGSSPGLHDAGAGTAHAAPQLPQAAGPWPGSGQGPPVSAWSPDGAEPPGTPVVVALRPRPDGEERELSPAAVEELKRVTARDFAELYKRATHEMAVLAAGAEAMGPGSPQAARLERYTKRILTYFDRVCLLSPSAYAPLTCVAHVNLETWQHERPGDEFWIALAAGMQLSPQQMEEVESIALMYERSVTPMLQERAKLSTQLSSTMAADALQSALTNEGLTMRNAVDELTQRLERAVLRERQVYIDLEDFLCWRL